MKAQQEARLLVAALGDTGKPAHQNPTLVELLQTHSYNSNIDMWKIFMENFFFLIIEVNCSAVCFF